jgi:hypothetical protein
VVSLCGPHCHGRGWRSKACSAKSFLCFAQFAKAFKHCHPLVLVDGTFLAGKYRGVLMIVVGVDPDNQLVPLAFALAEGENDDSCCWFMKLVRQNVLHSSRNICMISDRHHDCQLQKSM